MHKNIEMSTVNNSKNQPPAQKKPDDKARENNTNPMPKEIGGPQGPEPTRYGDWEKNGRCSDF